MCKNAKKANTICRINLPKNFFKENFFWMINQRNECLGIINRVPLCMKGLSTVPVVSICQVFQSLPSFKYYQPQEPNDKTWSYHSQTGISDVYVTSCYVQKPTLPIILTAALSFPWCTKKALVFFASVLGYSGRVSCDPRMLLVLKSIWSTAGKATINELLQALSLPILPSSDSKIV